MYMEKLTYEPKKEIAFIELFNDFIVDEDGLRVIDFDDTLDKNGNVKTRKMSEDELAQFCLDMIREMKPGQNFRLI
jgi:hypothetical protein